MKYAIGIFLGVVLTGITQAQSEAEQAAEQFFQQSDWPAAVAAYETLIEDNPGNGVYWQRLGASQLNLQQYHKATMAYGRALEVAEGRARNPIHFRLARAQAAIGSLDGVVRHLAAIADNGGTPFQAVISTPALAQFQGQAAFDSVLLRLRPCQTTQHRAFDFWLGQWQVTSPSRADWQASSSITLGNNGCTIHEAYSTPGGYEGTSVNFFDAQNNKWHQTWTDNQGAPLYLDGAPIENGMQLGDGRNRITWTKQADGSVRQHWQVTSDEGQTYTTAFDGYYRKVNP